MLDEDGVWDVAGQSFVVTDELDFSEVGGDGCLAPAGPMAGDVGPNFREKGVH